ncbi:PhzF family phenazine biosynthesis protein [Psychromarinibacter sp. C21-152]|uniref:PhzF family phenazine biosynthesis protein n=1 Tax=Psychromarinibacter sediminicola TaxID=3033385 RepID=A0AAE3NS94_9RHOB|nr:PhzF family phenazine biosynthesis protein [Psychromarinibacter sediminicola]MDF0601534.1 PhzF family phenazine biosynthesis protein [Psychromarinibacter sediminicola]
MPIEFDWVDAFTAAPFGGNGCAVVYDDGALSDESCMALVRETSLSECTFVGPSDSADAAVRYFLADREVPFAGHPTIATVASMLERGRLAETGGRLETGAGVIPIDVAAPPNGGGPVITMTQNAPVFGPRLDPGLVAAVGGLSPDDFLAPPRIVSTGLPFCIAVLKDRAALRRVALQPEGLRRFQAEADVMEPFWVTLGGETEAGDTFARLLLPPPLPPEDPFTGSATGAMAAFLWAEGLFDGPQFVAEQGHWMGRPGRAQVEVLGSPDAIEGVRVGGQGHILMRGYLTL